MTDQAGDPTPSPRSGGVTISRRALVAGGVVLLVLLVGAAVLAGVLIGSGGGGAPAAETQPASIDHPSASEPAAPVASESAAPSAPEPVASQPAAPSAPEPDLHLLGETFTTGNVTLTVHSVEIVDSIATVEGPAITPDPGGQLVLFRTTYSNSKTQADLSCGNTDLYIQVFDEAEREMAPVFDTYRIPGNPGCNDHLLQDTPHEWNFAFQSVAGATPLAMSVTETDKWLDPVWVSLK